MRIESEQKPLAVNDLNTCLLTQDYVGESMEVIQRASDSVVNANPTEETKKMLLVWKINTAKQLKKLAFQASPKVALLDVWVYMLKTKYFFDNLEVDPRSKSILKNATTRNTARIEIIALKVMNKREFEKYSLFVENQAKANPINFSNVEMISSVKDEYLKMTNTPDSISVETVGTLSEVVADLGSKLSYGTDLTQKQFSWETQLFLSEKGLDTIDVERKIKIFQAQADRLITIAENSPELFDRALINFRNQMDPIFLSLDHSISSALLGLSLNLEEMDNMFERERIALDSIVRRERTALTDEAHLFVDEGIKNTMEELRKIIRMLAIIAMFLIVIVLGLPFYAGYHLGKKGALKKDTI